MLRLAAAGVAAFLAASGATPANAIGLCGCCAEPPAEACAAACAKVADVTQCPSTVIFDGEEATGDNPLAGLSLKDLSLGDPSPGQLEKFRRFLEKYRRRAVRTYEREARKFQKGRLSRAEMDQVQAKLDEALVNYQHAIRAYLIRIGRKAD